MAALTGNSVASSYQGLLKTTANDGLGAADRRITSGDGTESVLSLSDQKLTIDSPGIGSATFEATVDSATITSDNITLSDAGVAQGFSISPTQTTWGGTVDFSAATVTGISGGGGVTPAPFVAPATGQYDGSPEGPYTFFSNKIPYYPIWIQEGQELTVAQFEVHTAFTSATLGMAIYNTQKTTSANSPALVPNEKLMDIGSVSGTTAGVKELTGFSFTAPYTGVYYIGITIPGVWDGALAGFNINTTFANSEQRVKEQIQYGGIAGTFFGLYSNITKSIIGDGTSHPATWAANKNWSSTSAYIFMGLRTN